MKIAMRVMIGALLVVGLCVHAPAQLVKVSAERAERAKVALERRLSHAASPAYDPYNRDSEAEKRVFELMSKEAFAEALAAAEALLAKEPLNIDVLMVRAAALRALGRLPEAGEARAEWMALVDSILLSGDGAAPATALRVIAVPEEYVVVRLLRLTVKGQKLVEVDGSEFDILEVADEQTGETRELYFNVDLPKRWLAARFARSAGEEKDGRPPAK